MTVYRNIGEKCIGVTHQCPVCGEEFIVRDSYDYAYKIRIKSKNIVKCVCSWRCVRKYEMEHISKTEKKQQERINKQLNAGRDRWYADNR